jgi:hypothetical protein
MNKELYQKFVKQIETELEFCDGSVTPLICYNFNNPMLRLSLVETIAETCISRKIGISDAIIEVEQMYSLNSLD